jgi:ribosomal protein S27AE
MITNRWRCNQCAVVTETDDAIRSGMPNNPPPSCLRCGQSIYGFRHEGRFSDGRLILSEKIVDKNGCG